MWNDQLSQPNNNHNPITSSNTNNNTHSLFDSTNNTSNSNDGLFDPFYNPTSSANTTNNNNAMNNSTSSNTTNPSMNNSMNNNSTHSSLFNNNNTNTTSTHSQSNSNNNSFNNNQPITAHQGNNQQQHNANSTVNNNASSSSPSENNNNTSAAAAQSVALKSTYNYSTTSSRESSSILASQTDYNNTANNNNSTGSASSSNHPNKQQQPNPMFHNQNKTNNNMTSTTSPNQINVVNGNNHTNNNHKNNSLFNFNSFSDNNQNNNRSNYNNHQPPPTTNNDSIFNKSNGFTDNNNLSSNNNNTNNNNVSKLNSAATTLSQPTLSQPTQQRRMDSSFFNSNIPPPEQQPQQQEQQPETQELNAILQSHETQQEKFGAMINDIMGLPGNDKCADCKTSIICESSWAIVHLGLLVCDDCKIFHIWLIDQIRAHNLNISQFQEGIEENDITTPTTDCSNNKINKTNSSSFAAKTTTNPKHHQAQTASAAILKNIKCMQIDFQIINQYQTHPQILPTSQVENWTVSELFIMARFKGNFMRNQHFEKHFPLWYYHMSSTDPDEYKNSWRKIKYLSKFRERLTSQGLNVPDLKEEIQTLHHNTNQNSLVNEVDDINFQYRNKFAIISLHNDCKQLRRIRVDVQGDEIVLSDSSQNQFKIDIKHIESILMNSKRLGQCDVIQITYKIPNGEFAIGDEQRKVDSIENLYLQYDEPSSTESSRNPGNFTNSSPSHKINLWINFILYKKFKYLTNQFPNLPETELSKVINSYSIKESYVTGGSDLFYITLSETRLACYRKHLNYKPDVHIALNPCLINEKRSPITAVQYLDILGQKLGIQFEKICGYDRWHKATGDALEDDRLTVFHSDDEQKLVQVLPSQSVSPVPEENENNKNPTNNNNNQTALPTTRETNPNNTTTHSQPNQTSEKTLTTSQQNSTVNAITSNNNLIKPQTTYKDTLSNSSSSYCSAVQNNNKNNENNTLPSTLSNSSNSITAYIQTHQKISPQQQQQQQQPTTKTPSPPSSISSHNNNNNAATNYSTETNTATTSTSNKANNESATTKPGTPCYPPIGPMGDIGKLARGEISTITTKAKMEQAALQAQQAAAQNHPLHPFQKPLQQPYQSIQQPQPLRQPPVTQRGSGLLPDTDVKYIPPHARTTTNLQPNTLPPQQQPLQRPPMNNHVIQAVAKQRNEQVAAIRASSTTPEDLTAGSSSRPAQKIDSSGEVIPCYPPILPHMNEKATEEPTQPSPTLPNHQIREPIPQRGSGLLGQPTQHQQHPSHGPPVPSNNSIFDPIQQRMENMRLNNKGQNPREPRPQGGSPNFQDMLIRQWRNIEVKLQSAFQNFNPNRFSSRGIESVGANVNDQQHFEYCCIMVVGKHLYEGDSTTALGKFYETKQFFINSNNRYVRNILNQPDHKLLQQFFVSYAEYAYAEFQKARVHHRSNHSSGGGGGNPRQHNHSPTYNNYNRQQPRQQQQQPQQQHQGPQGPPVWNNRDSRDSSNSGFHRDSGSGRSLRGSQTSLPTPTQSIFDKNLFDSPRNEPVVRQPQGPNEENSIFNSNRSQWGSESAFSNWNTDKTTGARGSPGGGPLGSGGRQYGQQQQQQQQQHQSHMNNNNERPSIFNFNTQSHTQSSSSTTTNNNQSNTQSIFSKSIW